MKRHLKGILSRRNRRDQGTRSWDIVFEWEDILSEGLGIPILDRKYTYWERLLKKLRVYKFINRFNKKRTIYLEFVTDVQLKKGSCFDCNIIPIIIDFWYTEEMIPKVIEFFKNVPLLLVTNREVYNILQQYKCPFPVEHFPLSLPDKYKLDSKFLNEKKYDFGFVGRIDPFFLRYIEKYSKTHTDFVYVFSKGTSVNREFYTNKGDYIGKDSGRDSYVELLRKIKVSCYSTPGIDESKKETGIYNQVTPRVLELLSNGCQVIGHYPNTADVRWYELEEIVPSVATYEEFEKVLDTMRTKIFNYDKVSTFLSKHYTSARVDCLKEIVNKHSL